MRRSELNSEQHSPVLDGDSDVLVAKGRHLRGKPQRDAVWPFQAPYVAAAAALAAASSNVSPAEKHPSTFRKPDAEGAVGLFFNDRYVMRRHVP